MNIAIDLHGTFDTDPIRFLKFIERHPQHKFFIFSGSPVEETVEQLATITGVQDYAHLLATIDIMSVVAFMKSQNFPMILKTSPRTGKQNWYFDGPEEVWWSMKSVMCAVSNIKLIIDDKLEYAVYFGEDHPTRFIQFRQDAAESILSLADNFIRFS